MPRTARAGVVGQNSRSGNFATEDAIRGRHILVFSNWSGIQQGPAAAAKVTGSRRPSLGKR